jgi:serine/threonine-protein kinase RsbW
MRISKTKHQFSQEYPATLKNVEQACFAIEQILEKYSLLEKDRFAVELLLREALNNAVLHGCDQNPFLSFSCRLAISGCKVIIEVSDSGPGFDWRRKLKAQPTNLDKTGRGLSIYAIYASSIEFNASGNCVTLKYFFDHGVKND